MTIKLWYLYTTLSLIQVNIFYIIIYVDRTSTRNLCSLAAMKIVRFTIRLILNTSSLLLGMTGSRIRRRKSAIFFFDWQSKSLKPKMWSKLSVFESGKALRIWNYSYNGLWARNMFCLSWFVFMVRKECVYVHFYSKWRYTQTNFFFIFQMSPCLKNVTTANKSVM